MYGPSERECKTVIAVVVIGFLTVGAALGFLAHWLFSKL